MEENIGAFEEKKRKKGGKRLMKPEKAVISVLPST